MTGSFGYAQNVQTLLVTYMNSFYNYSGNVQAQLGQVQRQRGRRRLREPRLTQQAGTANSSQSYNASVGYGTWITATGSYSKSSGQALATGAGLVPVRAIAHSAFRSGEPLRRRQLFLRPVQHSGQEAHPRGRLRQVDQQYHQ